MNHARQPKLGSWSYDARSVQLFSKDYCLPLSLPFGRWIQLWTPQNLNQPRPSPYVAALLCAISFRGPLLRLVTYDIRDWLVQGERTYSVWCIWLHRKGSLPHDGVYCELQSSEQQPWPDLWHWVVSSPMWLWVCAWMGVLIEVDHPDAYVSHSVWKPFYELEHCKKLSIWSNPHMTFFNKPLSHSSTSSTRIGRQFGEC